MLPYTRANFRFSFFGEFSAIYLDYGTRALVGFESWYLGFRVSLRSLEGAAKGAAPCKAEKRFRNQTKGAVGKFFFMLVFFFSKSDTQRFVSCQYAHWDSLFPLRKKVTLLRKGNTEEKYK